MVKVCGRYWPVRSFNIKGICNSEVSVFVCYLHPSIDTSKLGLTPGIRKITFKPIELAFLVFSPKLA